MARSTPTPPLRALARDLFVSAVVAVGLYLALIVLPGRVLLPRLTSSEVFAIEAGGVLLVAYLVAHAVSRAATAVIVRRGEYARGHTVRLFLNILIALAAVLAISKLAGVSAESILLGSAFAGIVLGLAAQTVLANVFAGLLLVVADPFHPGDRVAFVSSAYSVLGSTYPHETLDTGYAGTIVDIGLVYTILALERGGTAKLPNSVVLTALVLEPRAPVQHRVRLTLPLSVPVASIEAAVRGAGPALPTPPAGLADPHVEVADVSTTSWDAVVVLWSGETNPGPVRDQVLRAVLARLPSAGGGAPRPTA